MADGTISFVDGLGIKGIGSHEIRRKNRASAFTPQNLTPNQACGSKWVYPQPFSVRGIIGPSGFWSSHTSSTKCFNLHI